MSGSARLGRRLLLLGALLVFVLRVAGTYRVVNHTIDEPSHIATGLEILERGSYDIAKNQLPLQPPVGRAALAALPFLYGVRLPARRGVEKVAHGVLYGAKDYWLSLTLARIATLAFACGVLLLVYRWIANRISPTAGLAAVILLSADPTFIGHSGLATLDVPATAGILAALYCVRRYLDRPSVARAFIAGVAAAVAAGIKASAVLYVPLVALGFGVVERRRLRAALAGDGAGGGAFRRRLAAHAAAFCGAGGLALLACFGFEFGPLKLESDRPHAYLDRLAGDNEALRAALYEVAETPLPVPSFVKGLIDCARMAGSGHPSYFMGRHGTGHWPHYFFVTVALKATLPMLVLLAAGLIGWRVKLRGPARREATLLVLAGTMTFLVAVTSGLNVGIRHLLPVFPFMAGAAALPFANPSPGVGGRRWRSALFGGLLAWHIAESLLAHPDYIAYFNELVPRGREMEFFADSNLDWGQDIERLSRVVKARGIDSLHVFCLTNARLDRHGIPAIADSADEGPRTGWIAASAARLKGVLEVPRDRFAWLERQTPVARVGKSIFLYRVDSLPAGGRPEP